MNGILRLLRHRRAKSRSRGTAIAKAITTFTFVRSTQTQSSAQKSPPRRPRGMRHILLLRTIHRAAYGLRGKNPMPAGAKILERRRRPALGFIMGAGSG